MHAIGLFRANGYNTSRIDKEDAQGAPITFAISRVHLIFIIHGRGAALVW